MPRTRWSRLTITILVGVAVAVPGVAGVAHAEPSVADIERQIDREWHALEPVIEQHNATREALAAKRRQAATLTAQIEPLRREVDQAMSRVGDLAVRAYKGENASALNAMLDSPSPATVVHQLELLDRFARVQQENVQHAAQLRDTLAARKATLDELINQLSQIERQLDAKRRQIDATIKRLQQVRREAYQSGGSSLRPAPCPAVYPGGAAGRAVSFACAQIGKPYAWGAAGPKAYDCSGLTMAAWAQAGVKLPHNAAQQRRVTARVGRSELRPGDLVFYYSDLHHVGIYVGDGWVVHAPRAGKPVRMKRIDDSPVHSYGRPG